MSDNEIKVWQKTDCWVSRLWDFTSYSVSLGIKWCIVGYNLYTPALADTCPQCNGIEMRTIKAYWQPISVLVSARIDVRQRARSTTDRVISVLFRGKLSKWISHAHMNKPCNCVCLISNRRCGGLRRYSKKAPTSWRNSNVHACPSIWMETPANERFFLW